MKKGLIAAVMMGVATMMGCATTQTMPQAQYVTDRLQTTLVDADIATLAQCIECTCEQIILHTGFDRVDELTRLYAWTTNTTSICRKMTGSTIQLRDFAIAVFETLAGTPDPCSRVKGKWATKQIIGYWDDRFGHPIRFTLPEMNEDEYAQVRVECDKWIAGVTDSWRMDEMILEFRKPNNAIQRISAPRHVSCEAGAAPESEIR